MSATGGGRGTNQYQIKGMSQPTGCVRTGLGANPDTLAVTPPPIGGASHTPLHSQVAEWVRHLNQVLLTPPMPTDRRDRMRARFPTWCPACERPGMAGVEFVDGFDQDGFDPHGFNADGYDEHGFDEFGYDKDGYDADGFNLDGYDRDGFNTDDVNLDGCDAHGQYQMQAQTNLGRMGRVRAFLTSAADITYTVNRDLTYRRATIQATVGRPTITVDTGTGWVDGYWNGDHARVGAPQPVLDTVDTYLAGRFA